VSVKIRLTRTGAKHRPFYRIVVTDSRMPRDGRFIETLGTYDPLMASGNVVVDSERAKKWIEKGARPSVAVKQLLKRAGVVTVEAPPARAEAPSEAVSLDDLREHEEGKESEFQAETAIPEEEHKPARAKKKTPGKQTKPAQQGASKKEKPKKEKSK